MTKQVLDQLTEFFVMEIQSKCIDGITYTMYLKGDRYKEMTDKYLGIRRELDNLGFNKQEIFRVHNLVNGYIFDMDLSIAKKILNKLAIAVVKTSGEDLDVYDMIGNKPEERRKQDMFNLANYIQREFKNGHDTVEVALFNRNSAPRIMLSGVDSAKNKIVAKYNAYAIRHWDIEALNAHLLIPVGLRIYRLESMDVFPSCNGVRFQMSTEMVK